LGGPATEIYLTDEFLNELIYLETSELGKYSRMGINQCLFTIYVDGADYDWSVTQSRAEQLTPLLSKSFARLGTYLNYNTLSPVIDYDYVYEKTYSTDIVYDGYLDRSRGCYEMDITGFMQRLCNYVNSLDKISDYDETVTPRTIYLGPEAVSPYTFIHTQVQGSLSSQAPIHLEMTYTLVK
jgi:hypothetical protein